MSNKLILEEILARLSALETAALGRPRRRLSKTEVAREEGVVSRTVDRRVKERKLPPPDDIINGRLFWWSDSLERHRRAGGAVDTTAARAKRNPQLRKPIPPGSET